MKYDHVTMMLVPEMEPRSVFLGVLQVLRGHLVRTPFVDRNRARITVSVGLESELNRSSAFALGRWMPRKHSPTIIRRGDSG